MAVDTVKPVSMTEGNSNAATEDVVAPKQQGEYLTFCGGRPHTITLSLEDSGTAKAAVTPLSRDASTGSQQTVTSSCKDYNLNVYTSGHPSKDDIFMNRARACEYDSSGKVFRLGSRIFFNSNGDVEPTSDDHIDIPNLSLYLDQVERLGNYLFVTSRQKLLEAPEDDATDDRNNTSSNKKGSQDQKTANKKDESDSDSDESNSGSGVESEALSAYESWSEASTEYSETEVLRETGPQYAPAPGDEGKNTKASNSDSDASSDSSLEDNASADEDSDTESIEAPNTRYAHIMDDEEEDQTWNMVWDDPDRPDYDGDEWQGAWGNSEESDDGGNNQNSDTADSDSDSDDGEAKKEGDTKDNDTKEKDTAPADNGKSKESTTASSSADAATEDENATKVSEKGDTESGDKISEKEKESEEKPKKEEVLSMVGCPVAQLQVYDLNESPPTRIFRFTRPTTQMIRDSPLAIHPSKSLVVWPLGDNNMLFADFESNTFYIRKFRVSRFWSQHVKIECRFSADGKYLYVASLEMRRNLPTKSKGRKSKKTKDNETPEEKAEAEAKAKKEEEKQKPECDLIVLTYKLSGRKTARAPPVLIHRTQLSLGKILLAQAVPTFSWTDTEIFVTHVINEEVKLLKVDLSKTASIVNAENPGVVQVPSTPIKIEKYDQRAEVYFLPPIADEREARLIITMKQPALKKLKSSAKPEDEDKAGAGPAKPEIETNEKKTVEGSKSRESLRIEVSDVNEKAEVDDKVEALTFIEVIDYRPKVIEIKLENRADAWQNVDASQFNKGLEEGMGQMEVEMVKFDQTEDCDCCDD